jgi:hypothetical protein
VGKSHGSIDMIGRGHVYNIVWNMFKTTPGVCIPSMVTLLQEGHAAVGEGAEKSHENGQVFFVNYVSVEIFKYLVQIPGAAATKTA